MATNASEAEHASAAILPPRPDTDRAVFYGDQHGVCNARGWVAEHVAAYPRVEDITLVAAELASNTIRHTESQGGLFTVLIEYEDSGLAIVVLDQGSSTEPRAVDPYDDEWGYEHGYGMVFITELADDWGTCGDSSRRETWAWFARREWGRHQMAYLAREGAAPHAIKDRRTV